MTGKALELTKPERDVALITLTRPQEMNTLSHEFLDEFGHALDQLGENNPRALIVTGSGRAFCCGAHLKYFSQDKAPSEENFFFRDKYLDRIARLFDRLEEQPYPVIAARRSSGYCSAPMSARRNATNTDCFTHVSVPMMFCRQQWLWPRRSRH